MVQTLSMSTALRTAEDSMVCLKTRTQQKFEYTESCNHFLSSCTNVPDFQVTKDL